MVSGRRKGEIMFLDVASFKKELKSSYKGLGVEITHFENDMVSIAGTGWIIEVGMEDITKKAMAALVEHVGTLPERGYAYKYRDGEKEERPVPVEVNLLLDMYTKGVDVQDTRIMIQRYGTCYSVFQQIDTKEPMLVRRALQVTVDPLKVDKERDELPPEKPVLQGNLIIWNNDTMQLAIATTPYHNTGEHEFLKLINGKDMCWPFED